MGAKTLNMPYDKNELKKYGITVQSARHYFLRGFKTIEEILKFRDRRSNCITVNGVVFEKSEMKKYNITDSQVYYNHNKFGFNSVKQIFDYLSNKKPKTSQERRENQRLKSNAKNKEYILKYGVSYGRLLYYKRTQGFDTIEETIRWYHSQYGDVSRIGKIKADNEFLNKKWTELQNKISHLNCVISIESIRNAKINELQQNFYQQYGAM